jgi:vancomycin permeability regulator SanA
MRRLRTLIPRNRWLRVALGTFVVVILIPPLTWLAVNLDTAGERYSSIASVPHRQVALVFGAGLGAHGRPSPVLADRVKDAVELYDRGTVDGLLMSGDNHSTSYNEVGAMASYAERLGVPKAAITTDHAGFDTYDSCWRARHIFGVRSAVLVTTNFHVSRAVFTCRSFGIDAVGIGAPDEGKYRTSTVLKWNIREVLATAKAVWDVEVIHPPPTLGGPPVHLRLDPASVASAG